MSGEVPDPTRHTEWKRGQHEEYGQPKTPAHRSPEEWRDLISQRIEEAIREGKFDNLRSKGKPLSLAHEPHVPPEMQTANALLKNNDLMPAWISDRNQVLAEIERFRSKLRTVMADYGAAVSAVKTPANRAIIEQRWLAQLAAWQEEIHTLNRRIELQNLKQPVTFLEIFKLRLEDEMRRAEREPGD